MDVEQISWPTRNDLHRDQVWPSNDAREDAGHDLEFDCAGDYQSLEPAGSEQEVETSRPIPEREARGRERPCVSLKELTNDKASAVHATNDLIGFAFARGDHSEVDVTGRSGLSQKRNGHAAYDAERRALRLKCSDAADEGFAEA